MVTKPSDCFSVMGFLLFVFSLTNTETLVPNIEQNRRE